ncbi:MAG: formylglycine-generating enzyme family protein, partial [Bacteroidales bacterium]|nr:formylglycine-generating enzyme family protein [Bacteroidales bacterium]
MKNRNLIASALICVVFAWACKSEDKSPNANHEMNLCDTEFAFVEGGTFTMGCTEEQGNDCYNDEKPAHEETVKDFYIGKYEVTVAQFAKFVEETNYKTDADTVPGTYTGKLTVSKDGRELLSGDVSVRVRDVYYDDKTECLTM